MPGEPQIETHAGRRRYVQLSLLVWVATIGVDFFLHGGIFAAVYLQDSPFLLADKEAFRRIPLGYLALLATAGLAVWILNQASGRGWRKGLQLGMALGAVMGFSYAVGLFSISTASAELLAAWFVAQVIEWAIAGAIIGHGLVVDSLRRLTLAVALGFLLLFLGTIVMQSAGLVPATVAS
jgi:hypothetical protein